MTTPTRTPWGVLPLNEAWQRYFTVYMRHEAGETFKEIAEDLGVSTGRAQQLNNNWRRRLAMNVEELARYWPDLADLPDGNDPFPHLPISGKED